MLVLFAVSLCIVSFGLTRLLRRYALAKSIIDVPNERSSHSLPTPRGGGLAIVICFLAALVILLSANAFPIRLLAGFFMAGAITALLGFLDDHGHIPARWRLLGHFSSAVLLLWGLGGLPALTIFGVQVPPSWIGSMLACVYLVWLLNLYNFMDGIDGIASIEAITVCLGGALVAWLAGYPDGVMLPVFLSAAVAGFLFLNFPPAKIFMGDAGSGFLGLMIGGLSIYSAWLAPQLFWCWLILLGVFVVDATTTLLHRLIRKEKIYEAHRSHAYQYAARQFHSHKIVSLSVLAINVFWLLPLAVLAALQVVDGAVLLVVAYCPLVILALRFNAGKKEGGVHKVI
jgi:Fuc2NAc and GlcNAc transferase